MKQTHAPVFFDESFDVFTGYGIFEQIPEHLKEHPVGNKYKIFVGENIADRYGKPLYDGMKKLQLDVTLEPIEDGEEVKREEVAVTLRRKLHIEKFDRQSCLIIVGGGTLTDLVGYVAGIYMGGMYHINVPTTFISQTDAGIGGKTGVNNEFGKNMARTYYNPCRIYLDPKLLVSLPDSEITNGMGEGAKYALGFRLDLFEFLERNRDKIFARDPETLEYLVHESAMTKVEVVKQDPRERLDIRTCLNLGHTTAHGIETATNYGLPHGLAVGLGLLVASELSVRWGLLSRRDMHRVAALLELYGLPTKLSQREYSPTKEQIMVPMSRDKKVVGGVINFILPNAIGSLQRNAKGGYSNPVELQEIEDALDVIF